MSIHTLLAEFAAEMAHLFARFHSHPDVVAATVAQAAAPPVPHVPLADVVPIVPIVPPPTPAPAPSIPAPSIPAAAPAAVAPSTPAQEPAPAPPAPTPAGQPLTASLDHVLSVYGQHFPLPAGPTHWTVPNVTVGQNFGVELSGMNGATHLTIKRPDGTIAHRPLAGAFDIGPADHEFEGGGGGQLYVVADQPGTWLVDARNDDPGVISSIELLDPK